MKCILGLGNPDKYYTFTKHNIGFLIIDRFIEKKGLTIKPGKGAFFFANTYKRKGASFLPSQLSI